MNGKAIPKYMKLKREILGWLRSGRMAPNQQMPSENELAAQFRISRQTVRQTLGELEQEGWLYRLQGKGTFVAGRHSVEERAAGESGAPVIGIMTTYISDYIFPHIVRGAESALRGGGCRLLLSSTDNDKLREREGLKMLMEQKVDGVIIEPTKSAEGNPNLSWFLQLEYRRIPYLMINAKYPELNGPSLTVNDELGGYLAADHLLSSGHVRIAGFFKTDDIQGVQRLKGFMRAHQERKVPLAPEHIVTYGTEERQSKPQEAAHRLLQHADRPTGLVCYNDELAVSLLDAVRSAGLRVPGDLSLVGYDDSSLATATEVKLSTIKHPKAEMGKDAAEILLRLLQVPDTDGAALSRVYQPELILRQSTRNL